MTISQVSHSFIRTYKAIMDTTLQFLPYPASERATEKKIVKIAISSLLSSVLYWLIKNEMANFYDCFVFAGINNGKKHVFR